MNKMSQDYTATHKANHPESESRRKAKQRQAEAILRFHFTRHHLYKYKMPDTIDQDSDIFKRVRDEYLNEAAERTEVMEVVA